MRCVHAIVASASLLVGSPIFADAGGSPGLQPYTPTRLEWLGVVANSILRQDSTADLPFDLQIIELPPDTIEIYVRYSPSVNKKIMNSAITTARKVIRMTAKSYGWDTWVKVSERVEQTN